MFALIDANNFYVSCERLFEPKLQGVPVIVLSNNDGCVISRSQEAKAIGIRMGEPVFKIKETIRKHRVSVLSSNFALYGDISARMMSILEEAMPEVTQYSIDEAFCDLSSLQENFDIQKMCFQLEKSIYSMLGIPISIGIGKTMTLAKIASTFAKKKLNSRVYMLPEDSAEFDLLLKKIPVADVWGIGRNLEKRLLINKVCNAYQLKELDKCKSEKIHNINLVKTVEELKGNSCINIDLIPEKRKQIIVSRTLGEKQNSFEVLICALSNHVTTAATKLRYYDMLCSSLTVVVQYTPKGYSYKERKSEICTVDLPYPTSDTRLLFSQANLCLTKFFSSSRWYRKVGIILSSLNEANSIQMDLWGNSDKEDTLMKTVDNINSRMGNGTLYYARQRHNKGWLPKQKRLSRFSVNNIKKIPVAWCM